MYHTTYHLCTNSNLKVNAKIPPSNLKAHAKSAHPEPYLIASHTHTRTFCMSAPAKCARKSLGRAQRDLMCSHQNAECPVKTLQTAT